MPDFYEAGINFTYADHMIGLEGQGIIAVLRLPQFREMAGTTGDSRTIEGVKCQIMTLKMMPTPGNAIE